MEKTLSKIHLQQGAADKEDLFIPPTLVETSPFDILMNDELFGPILPILPLKTYDDAIDYIKTGSPPLAAYIFSKSQKKIQKFIDEIQTGSIVSNDVLVQYGRKFKK